MFCKEDGGNQHKGRVWWLKDDIHYQNFSLSKNTEIADIIIFEVLSRLKKGATTYKNLHRASSFGSNGGETGRLYPIEYLNFVRLAGLVPRRIWSGFYDVVLLSLNVYCQCIYASLYALKYDIWW